MGEYEQLDKAGKDVLLSREGLYASLSSKWRKQRDKGALSALGEGQRRGRPPVDPLEEPSLASPPEFNEAPTDRASAPDPWLRTDTVAGP